MQDAAPDQSPVDSAGWEALGGVCRRRGDEQRAVDAYRRATALNPARLGSWRAL
ncbi:MAG: tetratricopeptide repeat protein, partial [Gammaproteobacteria bacterium]